MFQREKYVWYNNMYKYFDDIIRNNSIFTNNQKIQRLCNLEFIHSICSIKSINICSSDVI